MLIYLFYNLHIIHHCFVQCGVFSYWFRDEWRKPTFISVFLAEVNNELTHTDDGIMSLSSTL